MKPFGPSGLACLFCLTLAGCEKSAKDTPAEQEPPAAPVPTAVASAVAPAPIVDAGPPPKKKTAADCTASKVVDFDGDAALEREVRLKVSKETGDVTLADLGKIRSLNLSQARVSSLDPCIFPHFKALKELFLGAGSLTDLSPLANLKNLEALRASLNKVADVKPLSGLTKMDRLDLGHTQIMDLAPLAEMTALSDLQIDDTQVRDLSPLSKLEKLERLSIQRTSVKSVAPLKNLKSLKFLYASGAPIEDLHELAALRRSGLRIIEQ